MYRLALAIAALIYFTIILVVALAAREYVVFVAFVLLVRIHKLKLLKLHFIGIILLGRYAVRAVLFPYANKLVTNYLDGQVNEKFGIEFAKILEKAYNIIKDNMLEPVS